MKCGRLVMHNILTLKMVSYQFISGTVRESPMEKIKSSDEVQPLEFGSTLLSFFFY